MSTKTKKAVVLSLMKQRWLTPLTALNYCGLLSLSQRVGELKREGYKIVSRRVPGHSYHEYRCVD